MLKSLLLIVLLLMSIAGQIYIFLFQRSSEGKDERGRKISYRQTSFIFNLMQLGFVALIGLEWIHVISPVQFEYILFYFFMALNILGAFYLFYMKKV